LDSNLRFKGKSGLKTAFSKSLWKNPMVFPQAHSTLFSPFLDEKSILRKCFARGRGAGEEADLPGTGVFLYLCKHKKKP
jgi:hypothetical protein